jgi:hypothetical protein
MVAIHHRRSVPVDRVSMRFSPCSHSRTIGDRRNGYFTNQNVSKSYGEMVVLKDDDVAEGNLSCSLGFRAPARPRWINLMRAGTAYREAPTGARRSRNRAANAV